MTLPQLGTCTSIWKSYLLHTSFLATFNPLVPYNKIQIILLDKQIYIMTHKRSSIILCVHVCHNFPLNNFAFHFEIVIDSQELATISQKGSM